MQWLRRFHGDERGIAASEYVLIVILVGLVACIGLSPIRYYLLRFYDTFEYLTGAPLP